MENKYAYATLITSDRFISGVVGLQYSLKKANSKYPLVVILCGKITEQSRDLLNSLEIEIFEFPLVEFIGLDSDRFKCTLSKFYVYSLEKFDKVCFLDADMIMQKNIDFIFKLPHDFIGTICGSGMLSGDIWMVKTDKEIFNKIKEKYAGFDNDEQVLNALFLEKALLSKAFLNKRIRTYCTHDGGSPKYWEEPLLKTVKDLYEYIDEHLKNL